MADFDEAVEKVIVIETANRTRIYTNDPTDRGGETKYGISKRAFPSLDIASLTEEDARAIYRVEYWRFESVLDQELANKLLSMAVLFGLSTTVRLLQNIVGVNIDGRFGPKSLAATNRLIGSVVLSELRIALLYRSVLICTRDTFQLRFVEGWIRRIIS